MPSRVGHQLHDENVIEISEGLRHAHAGGDKLIQRIHLGVLPCCLLLPAAEASASYHGARLTAAAHLAPLLISCTPLEAALRHVAIDLRAASVLPRTHHIHGRLLAALQRSDDFVNDAVIDQWL